MEMVAIYSKQSFVILRRRNTDFLGPPFSKIRLQVLYTNLQVALPRPGIINGPGHAKMCLMTYANNKGADQPVHPRSLISTLVVRCLDSMIYILAVSKVSRF